MRATFTTAEILAATGGTLVHQGAWDTFCGVSTDSRTSQAGELFIPLTGERHDGHEYHSRRPAPGRPGGVGGNDLWHRRGRFKTRPWPSTCLRGDRHRRSRHPHGPGRPGPGLAGAASGAGGGHHRELRQDHHQGDDRRGAAPAFRVLKNRLNLNNLIGMPLTLLGLGGDARGRGAGDGHERLRGNPPADPDRPPHHRGAHQRPSGPYRRRGGYRRGGPGQRGAGRRWTTARS